MPSVYLLSQGVFFCSEGFSALPSIFFHAYHLFPLPSTLKFLLWWALLSSSEHFSAMLNTSRLFQSLHVALLDVSRAHEIEICPSSVVRPSVSQLSLNLMHGFLSNFGCCFPWAIRSDAFWIFEYFFYYYFLRIFFVFVNKGPNGSENFKTLLLLQITAKSFTFSEFSSQWSSQNYVWIFEILKIEILMIFFRFPLT